MFYSRTIKQSNVAVKATKDILWFRQLLMELGFNQFHPTIVFAPHLRPVHHVTPVLIWRRGEANVSLNLSIYQKKNENKTISGRKR
jgi:hypothetical protein